MPDASSIIEPGPATVALRRRLRTHRIAAAAAAVVIVLTIGFCVLWNNGLRDRLYPKNFGIVEPGRLYRSGQISAAQIGSVLRDNHIRKIVCLSASGGKVGYVAAEKDAAAKLGIDRQIFPLGGDGTGSLDHYADAIAAIDQAEKTHQPVLVHCIAGAQRTGGVIALYQLLVEHQPPAAAAAGLLRFGHDPRDNPKLIPFLNRNMADIAKRLVDRRVISAVPTPLPQLPVD